MYRPLEAPALASWTMSDGYSVHGRVWRSAAGSGPPILYLHGVQSHGGWFERSASLLARTSSCLALVDRRGSGRNSRDWGAGAYDALALRDVSAHVRWLCRESGQERVGLVGVSWGGKLAALWAAENRAGTAKLLLIAPGLFPRVTLSIGEKLSVVAAAISGGQESHPIPLSDSALFTDNPDGRAFIESDPLKLTHASTAFMLASRRMDRKIAHMPRETILCPTTLLLGGRDRIVRNATARAWLARVCARVPCILELPDAAHTLEFDTDRAAFEEVLDYWGAAGG